MSPIEVSTKPTQLHTVENAESLFMNNARLNAVETRYSTAAFMKMNEINASPMPDKESALVVDPTVSLREHMSPVRNQGGLGACAAFGTLSVLEHFRNHLDLSEAHLIDATERRYGDCKSGGAIAEHLAVIRDTGIVLESIWPYDFKTICNPNPPDISAAIKYHLSGIAHIYQTEASDLQAEFDQYSRDARTPHEVVGEKTAFVVYHHIWSKRTPAIIDVPIPDDFGCGWADGPDISVPTEADMLAWMSNHSVVGAHGWHTLPLCGYDLGSRRFLFKNSWGRNWGDDGYGTLPFEYQERLSRTCMHGWI